MVILYLGPGLGGGVLVVVIGVLALLAITVFTFIWFPLKRLIRKWRK